MIEYLKRIAKAVLNRSTIYTNSKEYMVFDGQRFKNKVAIVTGGSGVIGGAIAKRLAIEGCHVYVCGRNEKVLDNFCKKNNNLLIDYLVLDVSDNDSIEVASNKVDNIDILVNCAGGSSRGNAADLVEQSVNVIDEMISINLRGSMLCSRAFGKKLKEKGKIINISSVIGERGKPRFTDYAAAKSGIVGYTKSLAQELGGKGITVNCVSPGFIQRGEFSDRQLPYLVNSNFLSKVGCAEDIASAVAFLASDEANFITGQNLCVDGGRSLGLHGD